MQNASKQKGNGNVTSFTFIGFLSIALLFTADYEGGKDLLDATIDYVRAQTAAIEAREAKE